MKVNEKLKQYSAMCISVLATQFSAKAEAVYTDIDPDLILDSDLDFAYIDLDNNGASDFVFFNFSYYTITSYFITQLRQRVLVWPEGDGNAIAGSHQTWDYIRYLPYTLETNQLINETLIFQDGYNQRMAFKTYFSGLTVAYGGNWYPEIIDHYLGVKFLDAEDCLHYGWIRCDIKDNGRTLIIKDYAYEIKCNTGILAGDTIGDTASVDIEEINLLNVNIYSFNNDIFVQFLGISENYSFQILNLSGAKISSGNLSSNNNIISLRDKPKGYYFVEIYKGNQKFAAKKIFIN